VQGPHAAVAPSPRRTRPEHPRCRPRRVRRHRADPAGAPSRGRSGVRLPLEQGPHAGIRLARRRPSRGYRLPARRRRGRRVRQRQQGNRRHEHPGRRECGPGQPPQRCPLHRGVPGRFSWWSPDADVRGRRPQQLDRHRMVQRVQPRRHGSRGGRELGLLHVHDQVAVLVPDQPPPRPDRAGLPRGVHRVDSQLRDVLLGNEPHRLRHRGLSHGAQPVRSERAADRAGSA
jgi:hypothetical protein